MTLLALAAQFFSACRQKDIKTLKGAPTIKICFSKV